MKYKDVGGPGGTCRGCKYFYHGAGNTCGNGFPATMNQTPEELCMKDQIVEAQKYLDAKDNGWRTLREIWEETGVDTLVVNANWADEEKYPPWKLIYTTDNYAVLLGDDEDLEEVELSDPNWRIYEPPKEKKKWAPALLVCEDGANLQPERWYSSAEEAKNLSGNAAAKIIWPAPGFTPTELPE